MALDGRDRWLRDAPAGEAEPSLRPVLQVYRLQVRAGREGALAAGQDALQGVVVLVEAVSGVAQLLGGRVVDGVAPVRAVHRDDGDRPAAVALHAHTRPSANGRISEAPR